MTAHYYDIANQFYPEFTKEDLDVFLEGFKKFDTDNSGSIDQNELDVALKAMGQGVTKEELNQIFSELASESGAIEWKQFLGIMRVFYPTKLFAYIMDFVEPGMRKFPWFTRNDIDAFANSFRHFDEDDSGTIDASEMKKALAFMGQGSTEAEVKKIIKEFDKRNTGVIDWMAWLEIMTNNFYQKKVVFNKEVLTAASKFPEFTLEEIYDFVFTFRTFDVNGDGHIDDEELELMFKQMGQGVSSQKVQEMIESVDTDGNGTIEWPEFLLIMRRLYPAKRQAFEKEFYDAWHQIAPEFTRDEIDAFVTAFRTYDIDGNGSIDTDELAIALKNMGQGCTPQHLQKVIAQFDADGNGTIEWPEFLQMMKTFYSGKPAEAVKAVAATPAAAAVSKPSPVKAAATPVRAAPAAAAPAKVVPKPAAAAAPAAPAAAVKKATPAPAVSAAPATSSPTLAGKVGSNTCASCGKTVFALEELRAADKSWHKACFKCEAQGCGITLNLKTFKAAGGHIYCTKHLPVTRPTVTTDSLAMKSATGAPKVNAVQGIQKNARMTFNNDP